MPPRRRRPRRQEVRKRHDAKCFFCSENLYVVLDAHRIFEGRWGGTYAWLNVLTVCANCHRKITAGVLTVHARRQGSLGNYYIHYTDEYGVEHFKKETRS